jgi:ABC-2 type transport system ATP-binding protein
MSLIVENLTKSYGNKIVVDNLSFEMKKPGVYALLGTNGAGKTTSIRMILGMISSNNGVVLWNNHRLDPISCNVGYLAEERGLYQKYSIMDQLMYFASLRNVSKADARNRIKYYSNLLGVNEYLYPGGTIRGGKFVPKKAEELSKGNQQKIQLMSVLISDPEILILDEPLSGLDPVNTELFKTVIYEQIKQYKYIIMSSHQMATIEEFCSDITILDKSKTVLQGNLNEIKKRYGRVNLFVKCESNIINIINQFEIPIVKSNENEYQLKVKDEKQANDLLKHLIQQKITLIRFELREPSLHEIFIEKVGVSCEKI